MAAPTAADRLRAWFLDNVPDNTPPEEVQGLIDVFAANGARSLVSLAEVTDEDVVCARARACCDMRVWRWACVLARGPAGAEIDVMFGWGCCARARA